MENKTKSEAKDENRTIYEVSYLLLPSLSPELANQTAAFGSVLDANSGTVIAHEEPVLIDLAYPMTKVVGTTRHKCDKGYFGWVKFEIESGEGILAVKKALDANDEVLRYLIVKTVRENTLLNGKMMLKKETKEQTETTPADPGSEEGAPEVVEEVVPVDLDKSIDDLVIA